MWVAWRSFSVYSYFLIYLIDPFVVYLDFFSGSVCNVQPKEHYLPWGMLSTSNGSHFTSFPFCENDGRTLP